MGIRGLKRYLALKYKGKNEVIPKGSHLLVDALGWLFFVVDNIARTQKQFGGSYSELIDVMGTEILRLRSMGVEPIFYFDGDKNRMKDATAEKRRKQREEKWLALYHVTLDDTDGFVDQSGLPSPPLALNLLEFLLSTLGVAKVDCDFEADQELALACQKGNSNSQGPNCYCYGADTDFYVLKDCPYIEFGTINDFRSEGGPVSAPVSHRKYLAEALNMTEGQLVEWCILIGNDYSEHFERLGYSCFNGEEEDADDDDADGAAAVSNEEEEEEDDVDDAAGDDDKDSSAAENTTTKKARGQGKGKGKKGESLPKGYNDDAFDTLRDIIVSRGDGFQLSSSSSAELQQAIAYSRAVYQLEDLSSYPITSSDGDASSDEAMRLTKKQKDVLRAWINAHVQVHLQSDTAKILTPTSVATHAISFLQKNIKSSSSSAAAGGEEDAEFPEISEPQLKSIEQMVQQLVGRRADPNYMIKYAVPSIMKAPKWPDVTFANLYQLVCREILKSQSQQQQGKSASSSIDISQLYDGKLFHFIVRTLSARPPLPPPPPATTATTTATTAALKTPPAPPAAAAGGPAAGPAAASTLTTTATPAAVGKESIAGTIDASPKTTASKTATVPLVAPASATPVVSTPLAAAAVITPATTPASTPATLLSSATAERLPIDDHRDEILKRVARDRVTIIHGETGCGKSSRLPVILLQDAEARGLPCRMMVSQPRRIAASSLMKRLRTTLGDKVGMRMGHGIRDDSDETQICFVTTGYLVRLLAHHPDAFRNHTHLIIDEVHERSVDGDLLCLLARRLLLENKKLRLILMSATVHTVLYKEYFSKEDYYGDMDCLSVGVRRFPLDIKYADDLASSKSGLPSMITSLAGKISDMTSKSGGKASDDVPLQLSKDQYNLAVSLIRSVGEVGSGILVFVSGIADITELTERFEGMSRYKLYAIHSDLPFEEQEAAFNPAGPDEVKVVIATNAAESSITLPDVDCVICLGTHKALRYHAMTHRVQLVNTWISKASATQRAGRTGRVRPGKVFRLYSKELHDKFQEHEQAEVHRKPLQDVILSLRNMLEDSPSFDGVVPLLQDLLEPPDMSNVAKSFDYLHYAGMLTTPDDYGELTSFGRLSGQLPVDLQLGRLIAYGVALGVGAEAVVMAASLSQPKSLFRIASPMIHTDPNEYNAIVQRTFLGCVELDGGAYSEPIMYLNMFLQWNRMKDVVSDREAWLQKYGVVRARMRQFVSVAMNLRERVQDALRFSGDFKGHDTRRPGPQSSGRAGGGSSSKGFAQQGRGSTSDILDFEKMGSSLSQKTINALRLALTWTSEGNVIRQKKKDVQSPEDFYTARMAPDLSFDQLAPLFPQGVNWKLETNGRRTYDASLSADRKSSSVVDLMRDLAQAAVSSEAQQRASVVWLVQQPSAVQEKETTKGNSKKKKQQKKQENQDENAFVVIAFDPTCSDKHADLVRSIFKGNKMLNAAEFPLITSVEGDVDKEKKVILRRGQATSATTTAAAGGGGGGGASGTTVSMKMYIVEHPSSKELKLLRKLHDDLPVSISMIVPTVGKGKVIASNCIPKRSALCRLFFGEYTSFDEMIGFSGNNEENKRSDRYISEQVLESSQRLVFPLVNDDSQSSAASGSSGGGNGGSGGGGGRPSDRASWRSSGKQGATSPSASGSQSVSPPPPPMLQDIPLGLRLLSSYRNGYRDKKLKVWKNPLEHNAAEFTSPSGGGYSRSKSGSRPSEKTSSATAAAADASTAAAGGGGRAAGASSSKQGGGRGGGGGGVNGNGDDDDRLTVNVKCASSTWQNLTTLGGNRDGTVGSSASPMALLPKQSVPAVALHWGRGTLYGVAHHSMLIGSQGGMMVGCEGVTILPPGSRWLNLALNCIEVDTDLLSRDFTAANVEANERLNEQESMKAAQRKGAGNTDTSSSPSFSSSFSYSSSSAAAAAVAVYDYPLTEDDVDLCEIIADVLEGLPSSAVQASPALSDAVDLLFGEWVNGKAAVPSASRKTAAATGGGKGSVSGKGAGAGASSSTKKQQQQSSKDDKDSKSTYTTGASASASSQKLSSSTTAAAGGGRSSLASASVLSAYAAAGGVVASEKRQKSGKGTGSATTTAARDSGREVRLTPSQKRPSTTTATAAGGGTVGGGGLLARGRAGVGGGVVGRQGKKGNDRHVVDSESLQWCLPDDVTKDASDFVLAGDDDSEDSIDDRWKGFANNTRLRNFDGGDDDSDSDSDDDSSNGDDDTVDDWEDISIDDDGDDIDIDDDDDDVAAAGGGGGGGRRRGGGKGANTSNKKTAAASTAPAAKNVKLGAGRVVQVADSGGGTGGKQNSARGRNSSGNRAARNNGTEGIVLGRDREEVAVPATGKKGNNGSNTTSAATATAGATAGAEASYKCPNCRSTFASNKACLAHVRATGHLSLPGNSSAGKGKAQVMNFIEKVCRVRPGSKKDSTANHDIAAATTTTTTTAASSALGASLSTSRGSARGGKQQQQHTSSLAAATAGATTAITATVSNNSNNNKKNSTDQRGSKLSSSAATTAAATDSNSATRPPSTTTNAKRVAGIAAGGGGGGASRGDGKASSSAKQEQKQQVEGSFQCPHCSKSPFTSRLALNTHITAKHSR